MSKFEDFVKNRVQRIAFMIEQTSHKIIEKEIKKMKKDIKKEFLNKLKK